jgi:Putative esterase
VGGGGPAMDEPPVNPVNRRRTRTLPGQGEPSFVLTLDPRTGVRASRGRVFVIIARPGDLSHGAPEPRENTSEPRDNVQATEPITVPFFGRDVAGLTPGEPVVVGPGAAVLGYPYRELGQLPAGSYVVQGFLNTYETNRRADGSVVDVHWPGGDGGDIWHSPGNVYSVPRTITLDPRRPQTVPLALTQVITPGTPIPSGGTSQQGNPGDSAHVKHLKIRSALLSRFWGKDVYIGANVLLPEGYDDPANNQVRYPMEMHTGHFPAGNPHMFSEALDDEYGFSAWWVSAEATRFISVEIRTENPFYDDSYQMNSANLGPYGDAVNQELLPSIDKAFRTIGQPWGRTLTGGSTGGWVSAATMVKYPDLFAGSWSGYPDALDFHAHQVIDVYSDANAYFIEDPWERIPRPGARQITGDSRWTVAQENHYELAAGSRGRSQGQWDIWAAVFGPQGRDGYPAPIWDKQSGVIDHSVAAYWKTHFDLTSIVTSNWTTLGPKLAGRMHFYVGSEDTYFLNNGVELFEQATSKLD